MVVGGSTMALAVAVCFLPLGLMLVEDKNSSLISSSLAPEALAVSLTHCSRVGFMPRTVVMLCNWSCSKLKILHSLMCSPYLILICTTTSVRLYPIFSLCALKAAAKTLYSSRPLVSSSFLTSLGVSIVPSRDDTLHPQNFQQEQLPKEETASEESLTPHKLHTASARALILHF